MGKTMVVGGGGGGGGGCLVVMEEELSMPAAMGSEHVAEQ